MQVIGLRTGFKVSFLPFLSVTVFLIPVILVAATFPFFTFTVILAEAPLFNVTVIVAFPAFFAVILKVLLLTAATLALLVFKDAMLSPDSILAMRALAETDFFTCTGKLVAVSFTLEASFEISRKSCALHTLHSLFSVPSSKIVAALVTL